MDTPETDQASRDCHDMPDPMSYVGIDFARRLERERNEARKIAETQALMLAKLDAGTEDLPWKNSSVKK